MVRRLWIAFLFLTVGLLTYACGSGGGGIQFPNCHKDGCPAGRTCVDVGPASVCLVVPTPGSTPVVTPGATATPQPGATSTPTPTPTPPPVVTPTPQAPTPTPSAPPTPVPTPCSPTKQKVCLASGEVSDGSRDIVIDCNTLPLGIRSAWTCADIRDYMTRPRDGAPGHWSQKEPGSPYFYNDPDNDPARRQFYDPRTCEKVTRDGRVTAAMGHATGHFPYVGERVVACPTPQPTPNATPTPGPTPTPGSGGADNTKLLKFGSEYFSCRVLREGRTRIAVNNTPRVSQFPGDQRGWEQPREFQDPRGPDCTQSRTGPEPWFNELMENTSSNPYFCHTALEDSDAGREYMFRACPRADVPLSPSPVAGFDRCSTVRVRFNSRGNVTCLEGCKMNSPVGCTQ